MKIPRALYGTHSDTKKWCAQHVKLIVKGATFEELDFGELRETDVGPIDLVAEVQRTGVVEGLVLLDSARVRNPEQHFRLYPLVDGLTTKWAEGRGGAKPIEQLFHWAAGAAWRIGCLLGEPGTLLCHRYPELRVDLLHSVLRHWPELIEVGPRWTTGLFHGELWELATNITRGLGQLGATTEDLRGCGKDMDALIRRALDDKLTQ